MTLPQLGNPTVEPLARPSGRAAPPSDCSNSFAMPPWTSGGGWRERAARSAGLVQENCGCRIGVEQDYVSRLEAGHRNPMIGTIWQAAALNGCGDEPVMPADWQ